MKLQNLVLISLVVLTTFLTIHLTTKTKKVTKKNYYKEYLSFLKKFKKENLSSEEKNYRYKIFEGNMKLIDEINSRGLSYKLGMNQFTDLTWSEFQEKYLCKNMSKKSSNETKKILIDTKNPNLLQNDKIITKNNLEIVDWRKTKNVSKVKNQLQCGSCWAFSTTGALESAISIYKKKEITLSEQELIDCSTDYGNNGCNGGLMSLAFDYIKQNKITTSKNYPYEGKDSNCRKTKKDLQSIISYSFIKPANNQGLMKALNKNPVSVAIEVQHDFMHYKSGVYKNDDCGSALNHGVLAVGYNNVVENGFFIVKNSWDVTWGDAGYVKMAIGRVGGNGTCGIANDSDVYPVVV